MAKATRSKTTLDFPFFSVLYRFYQGNKGRIRKQYKGLTKAFLDFNDPDKGTSFLRHPQFEALEMYIFLKEFGDNAPVHELFESWHAKEGGFEDDVTLAASLGEGQTDFFRDLDLSDTDAYKSVFNYMKRNSGIYPNYIFALTMGTGKTILMATCIFYEFLLANKFPKNPRYCHNALVFAPDKTVLQSLKEIQTFDLANVVPPEYVNFLTTHLNFHFLDEAGMALSTQDGSRFNIVISNAQKIIVKKQSKEKTAADKLFNPVEPKAEGEKSVYDEYADLYGWEPDDEETLKINARFQRLGRLPQLGIYVDEAHHALGKNLAKDFDNAKPSRLRETINRLATDLKHVANSRVVACYNYTGTPYIGEHIMPEVVYAYGLKDAIKNEYLKKTDILGFENAKSDDFVRMVIKDFWEKEGEIRREGMLPKIAFFASTIEELKTELKPVVEAMLRELEIPLDRILVNVGDDNETTNDDLREFIRLDSATSDKQFILLVNKGREGWNCRSLFGVALYRTPRSKIFVLQASMRCLRAVGDIHETGHIYLSKENIEILDNELQQNFRVTRAELEETGKDEKMTVQVKMVPPQRKITINRVRKLFKATRKEPTNDLSFGLDEFDVEKYRLKVFHRDKLEADAHTTEEDRSAERKQRRFSLYALVAEIARYFNNEEASCLMIQDLIEGCQDGAGTVLAKVNEFNELLYDHIIPVIFNHLYEITDFSSSDPQEVALVKTDDDGTATFTFRGLPHLIADMADVAYDPMKGRSFHLDHYIFDSKPEKVFFDKVLPSGDIEEIFFTGMLTRGQSEFFITYIDPESHTVRSYYPDFLIRKTDGTYVIVEIKGDNMIDDAVVKAKASSANQLAAASDFTYLMIKGTEAGNGLVQ